jgi:RHS repeat-associated protein
MSIVFGATSGRFAAFLGGVLLAVHLPAYAAVEYIHTDSLGTPIAITDSDGNVIQTSEYEPYGKLLNRPLTDAPGYAGQETDATIGMSYMQQRYYDPQLGRFLSLDPAQVDQTSASNFNRYAYANNSPYNFKDPDGRQSGPAEFIQIMANQGYPNSIPRLQDAVRANATAVANASKAENNAKALDKVSAAGGAVELTPTPASPAGGVVGEVAGALAFLTSPTAERALNLLTGGGLKALKVAAEAKHAEKAAAAVEVAATTHTANEVVTEAEHTVQEIRGSDESAGGPKSQVQEVKEDDHGE